MFYSSSGMDDKSCPIIPFVKMHGIGNDFVIIDQRKQTHELDVRQISDRRLGVGCDQLIVLQSSQKAECTMRIYNVDGSEAGACGNATRCVAYLIMTEKGVEETTIAVQDVLLKCWKVGKNLVKVDMGRPLLKWEDIPLSRACDTECLPVFYGELKQPVAVSMGNPHAVFFVDDLSSVDLKDIGTKVQNDPLFPEKVNVNIAQIQNEKIKLKVWERGVGETLACGSGACATLVAAVKLKLISKPLAAIVLPGGELVVEWQESVFMTGPIAEVFTGYIKAIRQ